MPRGRKNEVPEDSAPLKTETKNTAVKKKNTVVKFECGFAQLGKSTVAFNHTFGGKTYKYEIELNNKIFILPSELDDEEKKRYRAALLDNNFIDVTVNHGVIYNKKTGKYTYTAVHPEQTDRNRINATIALVLRDDNNKPALDKNNNQITKQVTILNGIVKTEDKRIFNALLNAGFYELKKEEVKE